MAAIIQQKARHQQKQNYIIPTHIKVEDSIVSELKDKNTDYNQKFALLQKAIAQNLLCVTWDGELNPNRIKQKKVSLRGLTFITYAMRKTTFSSFLIQQM